MTFDLTMPLEEDIYNGEMGHAAKHNLVNDQVNFLTEKLAPIAQRSAGGLDLVEGLRGLIIDSLGDYDSDLAAALSRITETYVTPQMFDPQAGTPGYDSTEAVQAAIDYALGLTDPIDVEIPQPAVVGNGRVFFPMGTYEFSDAITVAGTISMWGVGGALYAASVLRQMTEGKDILIMAGDTDVPGSQATVLEHLTFKSNSGTSSALVAQIRTADGIASNSLYIRHCWFKTPEHHAIWITQGDDIQITSCTFDVVPFKAIRLGKGAANACSNVRVALCDFYNVAQGHIIVDHVNGLSATGNVVNGSSGATSRWIDIPAEGAYQVRSVISSGNTLRDLFSVGRLTTTMVGLTFDDRVWDLWGNVLSIQGGGVLFQLDFRSTIYSTHALSDGAAFDGPGCGLQYSRIRPDIICEGTTALLYDLSDPRVFANHLEGGLFTGFTTEHNLVDPTLNGYAA